MASANSLLIGKEFAATQGYLMTTPTTKSPIIWLRWLGAQDAGATVAVAAGGDISFTTDGSTADTTVNTTGTIDCSTPGATTDTFGEIIALINGSANWQAYLLGDIPENSTNNTIAVSASTDVSTSTYKTNGVYLFGDGAVSYKTGWAISGFDPSKSTTTYWDDTNCVSYLQWADVLNNFSAAGTIKVYSANQTSSTLIFQDSLTDNTQTTFGAMSVRAPIIQSKQGERLVIQVVNDQSTANDNFHAVGYTIDQTGQRYVNGYSVTNALLT